MKIVEMEEEESDKVEWSPPNTIEILNPSSFICDPFISIHVQVEASVRSTSWSTYILYYLLSEGKRFKKGAIEARPIILISMLYN
jgi:hypothetical protein